MHPPKGLSFENWTWKHEAFALEAASAQRFFLWQNSITRRTECFSVSADAVLVDLKTFYHYLKDGKGDRKKKTFIEGHHTDWLEFSLLVCAKEAFDVVSCRHICIHIRLFIKDFSRLSSRYFPNKGRAAQSSRLLSFSKPDGRCWLEEKTIF